MHCGLMSGTDSGGDMELRTEPGMHDGRPRSEGDSSGRMWVNGKDLASASCTVPLWIAGVLFRKWKSVEEGWALAQPDCGKRSSINRQRSQEDNLIIGWRTNSTTIYILL